MEGGQDHWGWGLVLAGGRRGRGCLHKVYSQGNAGNIMKLIMILGERIFIILSKDYRKKFKFLPLLKWFSVWAAAVGELLSQ